MGEDCGPDIIVLRSEKEPGAAEDEDEEEAAEARSK